MEPSPGLMVTPTLRLSRIIGKGGMGSVWVADHLGLDTEVAVKFVDGDFARKSKEVLVRFKREAGIAAKLKSPHAVQTFDHGVLEDGTPYIVMELLEGESLHRRLKREPLSLHETALFVTQMVQVLSKAHGMGIIHRDIKPGNVFLIDTGYDLFVKLLDFGIAKHTGGITDVGLTATGAILGSPLYMSPEQFLHVKGVDARGDLWALAVVAYHCLAGIPAFNGDTLGQVIIAVTNCTYEPISTVRADVPAPLDEWFAKAFERDIEQRFQSAREMGKAFGAIARGEPMPSSRKVTAPTSTPVAAPTSSPAVVAVPAVRHTTTIEAAPPAAVAPAAHSLEAGRTRKISVSKVRAELAHATGQHAAHATGQHAAHATGQHAAVAIARVSEPSFVSRTSQLSLDGSLPVDAQAHTLGPATVPIPPRRRRMLWGVAAFVAAVLLVIGVGLWSGTRDDANLAAGTAEDDDISPRGPPSAGSDNADESPNGEATAEPTANASPSVDAVASAVPSASAAPSASTVPKKRGPRPRHPRPSTKKYDPNLGF